jgi:hypothetical protein
MPNVFDDVASVGSSLGELSAAMASHPTFTSSATCAILWQNRTRHEQFANATDHMRAEATVTVKTYATEVAAEGAAACLEANGIRCLLTADDCGGMLSPMDNYSGVKLIVASEDAESAREILSREGIPETGPLEDEAPDEPG